MHTPDADIFNLICKPFLMIIDNNNWKNSKKEVEKDCKLSRFSWY